VLALHERPAPDNVAAGRCLGTHGNWARYWRRTWATAGFRLTDTGGRGRKPAFPPRQVATVEALACAPPTRRDEPLGRHGTADLTRLIAAHPERPPMRRRTIRRILDRDARTPWRHRSWITVRDPDFAARAGRVLDLDEGYRAGHPLAPGDCVLSADEQTSLQARRRRAPATPPRPGQAARVAHEDARGGALASLAAWDVRRGGVLGRREAATGIAPFDRLVGQVLAEGPYRSAPRVFRIVDHGSSHRGTAAVRRLEQRHPDLVLVHPPVHASWRNQIERSCSIVQRKALSPNDFPDLAACS